MSASSVSAYVKNRRFANMEKLFWDQSKPLIAAASTPI